MDSGFRPNDGGEFGEREDEPQQTIDQRDFAMLGAPRHALPLLIGLALGLAGAVAAALPANAVVVPMPLSRAPAGAAVAAPVTDDKGSAAFQKGLDVLVGGDAQAAYNLAMGLPSDLERRTLEWAAIYYGRGTIDYHNVENFAHDAPSFAPESLFRARIEQSLINANPSDADIINYLGGAMPNSVKGDLMLASAYARHGEAERGRRIVTTIWDNYALSEADEKLVLANAASMLSPADHWARTVHLLMTDRASSVSRMLPLLTPAEQSLAKAGIAVIHNEDNAHKLIENVDPSLRKSAVFYFLAAENARLTGQYERALADLNAPSGELPDAAQWWYERRSLIRQLLLEGNAKLAYAAADTYTHGPEGRLVEARFHAGWIALCFLGKPAEARPHFEKMLTISTLPDSITQANYWLGRTELALGNADAAKAAFGRAARYGTTYYGLLARTALGEKPVQLRSLPPWQGSEAAFNGNELVKAVKLLAANGQGEMAAPLLRTYASHLKDGGELLLAARLAQAIDAHYLAIEIADMADKRGTPLDLFDYPMDPLPPGIKLADVDKAAVYAVARQESRFRIDAVSSSGARGLMQLMPATAKEVAHHLGVKYSRQRLTSDARYNALLGSSYLARQLAQFDGSLALAAASYNAGASNAAKWVQAFGDPRASNVDPVVWVELIPFEQTRQYVKRVMSNYLIYRARMGADPISMEQALRKISS
jgi:soluble lytic murein transglycosylase